jgi:Ca2+/Na+ antiporter
MAVANALGSNTFNINIALGVPWLCYVLKHGGRSYRQMKDDGIVMFLVSEPRMPRSMNDLSVFMIRSCWKWFASFGL